jgi:glycosyltransferase involved in cell wall biosynthesis
LRIVIVSYQGYDGAGVLHAHEFANQLVDLGHQVHFFLNGSGETLALLAEPPRYALVEVSFRDGMMDAESAESLRGADPEIVHLWTPRHLPARVGLEAYQTTDAALIIHYEDDEEYILESINTRPLCRDDVALYRLVGSLEPQPMALQELVATIDRSYLRLSLEDPTTWFWIHPLVTPIVESLAAGITCISPSYLREMTQRQGKPGLILYPGVDQSRFGGAESESELIESLDLGGRTVILYSGTIAPFHDFVSVLRALPQVVAVHPEVVLVQIGRNLIEATTQQIVDQYGLESHVRFVGPVPHHSMERYLALADLFVGCVRPDRFNEHRLPSKVPEYLAVGRPVLISSQGVGREFEDGLEVGKVDDDDPESIAVALLGLLARRDQWPRMGERVRKKARTLFDWRSNTEKLVGFYQEILMRERSVETSARLVDISPPALQAPMGLETEPAKRSQRRVMICTESQIGACMGGVGIRYLELCRALSRDHEVSLWHRGSEDVEIAGVEVASWSGEQPDRVLAAARSADVVVVHGYVLEKLPTIRGVARRLVVDLYCPFIFENLEIHRDRGEGLEDREQIHRNDLRVLIEQVEAGDYFLCCTEGQRNWLLGMLTALGRLSPRTSPKDAAVADYVGLVPFGLPDGEPPPTEDAVLRGVWPGVDTNDTVLLWGGGLWSWLDPEILVRAMQRVSAERLDVKLVFLSTLTAEPLIDMPTATAAIDLAVELGLEGQTVLFNRERYIPYSERSAYFVEADFGICAHRQSLETHMAFRTRLLDCVYAGTPILTSGGDYWSELVEREEIGRSVPVGDVDAWVRIILDEAANPDRKMKRQARMEVVREHLRWSRVMEPLARFIAADGSRVPLAQGAKPLSDLRVPVSITASSATNDAASLEALEAEAMTRARDFSLRDRRWRQHNSARAAEMARESHRRQRTAEQLDTVESQLSATEGELSAARLHLAQNAVELERLEAVALDHARLLGHASRLEAKVAMFKRIPGLTALWRQLGSRAR